MRRDHSAPPLDWHDGSSRTEFQPDQASRPSTRSTMRRSGTPTRRRQRSVVSRVIVVTPPAARRPGHTTGAPLDPRHEPGPLFIFDTSSPRRPLEPEQCSEPVGVTVASRLGVTPGIAPPAPAGFRIGAEHKIIRRPVDLINAISRTARRCWSPISTQRTGARRIRRDRRPTAPTPAPIAARSTAFHDVRAVQHPTWSTKKPVTSGSR